MAGSVNHPDHYNWLPNNIECIDVAEWMDFNTGNALKYLWRAGHKTSETREQDLRKAIWYLEREIVRMKTL